MVDMERKKRMICYISISMSIYTYVCILIHIMSDIDPSISPLSIVTNRDLSLDSVESCPSFSIFPLNKQKVPIWKTLVIYTMTRF